MIFRKILLACCLLYTSHSQSAPLLTLEQSFKAALEKSESVGQSGAQLEQARQRVSRLKGGLLPDVSFNANYTVQQKPKDPIAQQFSPAEQTTAQFTAVQPIFRGLREFAGLSQQKRLVTAQEALQSLATQELYQRVASSQLQVLSLEQDLRNLEQQVDIYGKRVSELRGRARRGESSSSEMLSAESTQNALQADLRLVQGQLKVAREAFHSLTGLPRESALADPALSLSAGKLDDYLARIGQRPDVQAAIARSEAGGYGMSIARGAHFPTLDAVGNYYLKRPGFLSETKWDVQFRLAVPLFAGGATQAQVREAAAANMEGELELARVRRLADEEIRSLHESLRSRLEQIALLRKSAELAEKNVDTSQREFRRGLIRSVDVQQALGEYRVVRRSLDQARFSAQLERLRLEIAAGMTPQGQKEDQ